MLFTPWDSFQGEELASDRGKYEIVQSGLTGVPGVQSKLIIKKTEEGDFGTYQVGYKVTTWLRKLGTIPK